MYIIFTSPNQIQLDSVWEKIKNQTGLFPNATTASDVTLGFLISKIIPYIFTLSGIILLIFIILSGFQLMLSGGDPKKAQAAKARLTTSLTGFFIIFLSYWIVQIIAHIFDIKQIKDIFL